MASRNVQKSSIVSRFFKWLGLFAAGGAMMYIHYHRNPPDRFQPKHPINWNNIPSPKFVWEDDATQVITGNNEAQIFKQFEQQIEEELNQK